MGSEWHEEEVPRAVIEGEHQDRTDERFFAMAITGAALAVVENLVQ